MSERRTITERNHLYRELPQIGEFLNGKHGQKLMGRYPRALVIAAVRSAVRKLRDEIRQGSVSGESIANEIERLPERVTDALQHGSGSGLRPVINATGVILQTNLGRAALSEAAIERIADVARGYCNLEFDLETGARGQRGSYAEELLLRLVSPDSVERAALVVNNCAAATFLALNSLAEGGEVIVSRGELVEIGGGFRVPEILRKSGARLVEVGTTNRTRIEDYVAAITSETRLLLRVHRSNFQIVGFAEEAPLSALVQLGAEAGVPVFVDQGTGCVSSLADHGLGKQSSFAETVASGAALVCASGDKLLGGPQCGLIIGEQSIVSRLGRNPLYRALRVDKLTLAALEATLLMYLSGQEQAIPTLRMLGMSADTIKTRCQVWANALACEQMHIEVVASESVVGGGTTPGATLPSFALALQSNAMSADQLAWRLRRLDPPIIARVHDSRVLLDLRTVPERLDESTFRMLRRELVVPHSPSDGAP